MDISPVAGYLLKPPYSDYGTILYGDAIQSLARLDRNIDLFINDSDHSLEYEMKEFETIAKKLSGKAVIVSDNAHFSDRLMLFALKTARAFLYFQEQPAEHWYGGAGIGAAYPRA